MDAGRDPSKERRASTRVYITVGFDLETYFIITLGRLHRNQIKIWLGMVISAAWLVAILDGKRWEKNKKIDLPFLLSPCLYGNAAVDVECLALTFWLLEILLQTTDQFSFFFIPFKRWGEEKGEEDIIISYFVSLFQRLLRWRSPLDTHATKKFLKGRKRENK